LAQAPPGASVAGPPADVGEPRRRVLVIEDNADAAESLKILLELDGHAVETAARGPEGIEAARRSRPDVVFCDLALPGMNGYDVCAALRADPATAGALIVAMSGRGSEGDAKRCEEAGFDLHLVKPVDPKRIAELLRDPPRRRR